MTIKNFVETYIGKAVDENGIYRGQYACFPNSSTKGCHQCVSIVKFFCKKLYNAPQNQAMGNAADAYNVNNLFFSGYQRISKTKIPKRGDIVVFEKDKSNFYYGHIGIVLYADKNSLYFLEQNAGNGDGYGTGANAIRISVKKLGEKVLGYRRFPGAKNIIMQDEFDNLLYNNAPYIWEATNFLKRNDVALKIKQYFGRVDWNGERPNDAITRHELATMIARVSGKPITSLYNGTRRDDRATGVEFTIMMQRGKK